MSFKDLSASVAAPSNEKPDDKTKAEPVAQPAKKQDDATPAKQS